MIRAPTLLIVLAGAAEARAEDGDNSDCAITASRMRRG